MSRWSHLLLLTLVFGALNAEEEKEEDECAETGSSESEMIHDTEETFVLTKDICINAQKSSYLGVICCNGIISTEDKDFTYCALSLKKNHNNDDRQLQEFTKVTECFYKRKKYIKDSKTLDFDQIEADAAKLEDPLQEKFMMDAYRYCGCKAKVLMDKLEQDVRGKPKKKIWRLSLRKPYFYYVFSCFVEYPSAHQCPYFRYAGYCGTQVKCMNYAKQCEDLMKEE